MISIELSELEWSKTLLKKIWSYTNFQHSFECLKECVSDRFCQCCPERNLWQAHPCLGVGVLCIFTRRGMATLTSSKVSSRINSWFMPKQYKRWDILPTFLFYLWRQGTDSLLVSYITLWSPPPLLPSPLQLSILCAPKLLCRKVKVQLIVSSPKIAFSPLASKFKSFCQKRVWCKALASYSQMNTKRKEQKKPQFFFLFAAPKNHSK